MMRNLMTRARGRRNLAVVAVTLVAFGGFAVWRSQAPAQALNVTQRQMNMTCGDGPLGSQTLSVDYRVTAVQEPRAGGPLDVLVQPTVRLPAGFPDLVVTQETISLPNPKATYSLNSLTTNSSGWDLRVYQGPQTITASAVATQGTFLNGKGMPNLVFHGSVDPLVKQINPADPRVMMRGPSQILFTLVLVGSPLQIRCTPVAGNPPLLSLPLAA
jgi:hypothetical protein